MTATLSSSEGPQLAPASLASGFYQVIRREPEAPLASIILLVLGGGLDLVTGIVLVTFGGWARGALPPFVAWSAVKNGSLALAVGALMVLLGLGLVVRSSASVRIGVVAVILCLLSLVFALGSPAGDLLGIVGGVLSIAWVRGPPFYVAPPDAQTCRNCGRIVWPSRANCPDCHMPC